ncbi:ABC-type multidrug transport system, ATPase and permease component, partial [Geosmithia morbida]
EIWLGRLRHVSQFIGQGNLHLICIPLSLIPLLFTKSRWKSASRPQLSLAHSTSLASALPQMIFAATAFSISLYDTVRTGAWKEAVCLAHVFILHISRFIFKSSAWTAYHHMNAIAGWILLLAVIKSLLPLIIMDSHCHVSTAESLKLASIAALLFTSFISPRSRQRKPSNPEDLVPRSITSPEETCSWFSYYLSYEWLTQVILRGFSRDLVIDDLPALPSYDMPLLMLQRLLDVRARGWKLFWSLCLMFRVEIRRLLVWAVLTATVEYVAPLAMFNLLRYLERADPEDNIIHPFVWIALLFLGPTARSACYQQSIFRGTRLLVLSRAVVIQEVYHKLLRSRASDYLHVATERHHGTETSHGPDEEFRDGPASNSIKIESLMSYDADMISNATDMFYAFTASALSTVIAMSFLYTILGWPSLIGVLVLAALTPLPAVFSGKLSRMQESVMKATDARLSSVSEYLNSIRTLKYFAWEPIAAASVNKIRIAEQQRIWRRSIVSMLVAMTGDMLSLVSLLAMFTSLILLTDRPLTAPAAFTSLAITEVLRSQYVWLSKVVQWVAQAKESVQRVDKFMEVSVDKQRHPSGPASLKNATFSVSAHSPFKLRNLSIQFREGALNVITGPTGSGKTSMLLSLLGETNLESGEAVCPLDVAYVPQTAWIQNSTIRQNILFYSAFDEKRYRAVTTACALDDDLARFPLGDLTPVGERGSTLSGGQKQRISLARALYSSSSTLFLDDVFSALDAHTASQVYNRCFFGNLLAGRTVVLVTHFIAAIQSAELVVSLEHGRISFVRDESDAQTTCPTQEEQALSSATITPTAQSIELHNCIPEVDGVEDFGQNMDVQDMEHGEKSASGRVPRSMILSYVLLFGGLPYALLAIFSAMMVQVAYFSITLWLSIWTGSYTEGEDRSKAFKYLLVYIGTVLAFVSLQFLNNFIYQRGGWNAAKTMHQRLVTAVINAPIIWFDRTPIGQILNRFGLDTQSLDSLLVDWLRMTLDNGLRFLLRLASIASIMPIFALPAAFFCLIGFATGELYSRAEISIKRLVAAKFAPVFSHFNDTCAGIAVIRGRNMDAVFQKLLADKLVPHMRASETQFNCNRWVSVRSDCCAATIAATAGFIAYYKAGSAGLVGFSLTNAIGLSQTILTLVRNMNELEVELNSFQRISQYTKIEPEESEEKRKALEKEAHVAASWPSSGQVEFRNVTARYSSDGPNVLHDVDFVAKPGERIAVIGRTGSGKSTLALSLLRSTQIVSGGVTIDGIDVGNIPLGRLRQSIGLIPQEPMLFSGDVRSNIDPSGEMDETELQSVLSACSLAGDQVGSTDGHAFDISLDTPVAHGGRNFSNGQRQIIGLARAICRRSKVVIMDEATASVDHETDKKMQAIIRSEFSGSTIITIAHRLRTIMDYDRVVVMGGGKILE